jgi:hypothetical protein
MLTISRVRDIISSCINKGLSADTPIDESNFNEFYIREKEEKYPVTITILMNKLSELIENGIDPDTPIGITEDEEDYTRVVYVEVMTDRLYSSNTVESKKFVCLFA